MSTEVLLNEFKEYSEHPYRVLSEYKKQGKKVIGMLPYYAPAELVVAAGMVPMGIWGSNKKTDVYKRQAPRQSAVVCLSSSCVWE